MDSGGAETIAITIRHEPNGNFGFSSLPLFNAAVSFRPVSLP